MQLLYPIFYRQFGIRRPQGLFSPRLVSLQSLPRDSIIHYATFADGVHDLDESKLYFQGYSKKIIVDYPEVLTGNRGVPKRTTVVIKNHIKPFHMKSKIFRYMRDHYKLINDSMTLLVFNYNYLDTAYRYVEMPMTPYNKWWNIEKTMWDNIEQVASSSNRNQFVFIDVPKELPSFSFLNVYSDKLNPGMLKIFDSPDKLFMLELWKWLSDSYRSNSVMSGLKSESYGKVNLVFTNSDNKSVIINLGYLNSWIKGQNNVTEFKNIAQFPAMQVQKLFLKLVMTLQEVTIPEEIIETSDIETTDSLKDKMDVEEEKELEEELRDYENDNPPDEDQDLVDDSSYSDLYKGIVASKTTLSDVTDNEIDAPVDMFTKQLADIDDDISILERMNRKKLKEHGLHLDNSSTEVEQQPAIVEDIDPQEAHNEIYQSKDYDVLLKEQLDDYAEYGLLSASDYKKLSRDVDAYNELKDPYGSKKSIVEAMKIAPEDIQLDKEKITINAPDTVIDKSMLESSLISFTSDYVKNVMHKDMLSMTSSLQRSGVIIKKHEIEHENSALGSYENHTLEIRPIDGVASTLRFRVPKIDEDGRLVANGNKYIQRLQRVDKPIRKIDPHKVALTSYYGKNFVTRSQKKANSSIDWIIKRINIASITDGSHITNIAPAMVFDNNFNAPYIYNALAAHYKSFKAGKYTLVFDHNLREQLAKKYLPSLELLEALESDGKRLVGYVNSQEIIVVDNANDFYVYKQEMLTPIGNIFTLLQLPEQEAPVDFTEVRIFSKTVPVGVVLGYFIGFKKLLRFLNVAYRIVEGRKNKALEAHEYAISFKDESYVFSRKDQVAAMVLSGFLDYEKQIKQHLAEDFDNKDVYFNLLSSKGLSALYLRELELTDQLFVDPITKSILEDMNEPTTFRGLLIRATELLTYYHHEDSQDMSVMRIRGYERISGVVYKEMVAAIRQFKNRNIAGRSKVDMSPYQVWQTIMKDPAMKLVEDTNPIQNLKESEVVTYVGEGGRGKDSMNKKSRAYHPNDMGVISEATVDSSDVGVNAYLSANPNFKNLRGITTGNKTVSSAQLISTSALLAPSSDKDDVKRINNRSRVRVIARVVLP